MNEQQQNSDDQFELQGSSNEQLPNFPEIPNIDDVLQEAESVTNQCYVMHGSHGQYADVAGQTVGEVRKVFRPLQNIPEGATALINGAEVDENQIIQPAQTLQFVKESGTKGFGSVIY